mgnify:CR=1 FL=1
MTTKELLYVEDALSHAKFCIDKCNETAEKITDGDLKACVQNIAEQNKQLFGNLYGLL